MILRAGRRPDALFVGQIRKTVFCAAALAAAVLVVGVATVAAAKPCAQKVIDDWYENGRVDNVYPVRCYRDALKLLPDDVRSYSDAPDEINRALQDAIRQERDQINPSATGGVAGTTSNPDDQEPAPGDTTPDLGAGGGGSSGDGGASPPSSPASPSAGGGDSNGLVGDAIKNLGPGSADSIPVPLIIVGALALLLLAAGSAGLVARRLQARRIRGEEVEQTGRGPGL